VYVVNTVCVRLNHYTKLNQYTTLVHTVCVVYVEHTVCVVY